DTNAAGLTVGTFEPQADSAEDITLESPPSNSDELAVPSETDAGQTDSELTLQSDPSETADSATKAAADALFADAADQALEPQGIEQDFAVVFVGKMQFLLPREQVAAEFDLTQTPAPIGGAPTFVAGQIEHNGKQVLLIDLAGLSGIKPHQNTPRKVVLLGKKGLWGIVAEQPKQIREISPEQIAWREQSERDKRRVWLAGTVNAEQTAVLDVAGLKASLRAERH
ncbi:MAG TPA: chemotaxis protein CheW, partial [Halothiobacillaceae bacterium]|nr:chemotaxis protein CheW [Halothiobacillaceae bacterium]